MKIEEEKKLRNLQLEQNENLKDTNYLKNEKVDGLIDGKVWKDGENYAYIKILSKDSILDITKNEMQAEYWFNSEKNKLITDAKLYQFKKNKNIDEAIEAYNISVNNSGLNFNLKKARELVTRLKQEIKENKKI